MEIDFASGVPGTPEVSMAAGELGPIEVHFAAGEPGVGEVDIGAGEHRAEIHLAAGEPSAGKADLAAGELLALLSKCVGGVCVSRPICRSVSALVERKPMSTAILDVIEHESARLIEVHGLGPKRTQMIAGAWDEQKAIKEVMVFLVGVGVSTSLAVLRAHDSWRSMGACTTR